MTAIPENATVDRRQWRDLMCVVCDNILTTAQMFTCGHSVCNACAETIMARTKKCAVCRETCDHLIPNWSVRGAAGCVTAGCCLCQSWEGTLADFEGHMTSCPDKIVQCKAEGCIWEGRRKFLEDHTSSCEYVVERCYCGEEVRRLEQNSHLRVCTSVQVVCPLGCNEQILRADVHIHMITCRNRVKRCELSPKCNALISSDNMQDHILEKGDGHLQETKQLLDLISLDYTSGVMPRWRDNTKDIRAFKVHVLPTTDITMQLGDFDLCLRQCAPLARETDAFCWGLVVKAKKECILQIMILRNDSRSVTSKQERVTKGGLVQMCYGRLPDEGEEAVVIFKTFTRTILNHKHTELDNTES